MSIGQARGQAAHDGGDISPAHTDAHGAVAVVSAEEFIATIAAEGDFYMLAGFAGEVVRGQGRGIAEGLAEDGRLSALQQAFHTHGAAQCGICTPGMLLAARALPDDADDEQIRAGLAGNLCRCTGYIKIYDAVAQYLGRRQRRRRRP